LSSGLDRGEEDGGESTHDQIPNNWTGNSDGRVSASADAMSIHTVCECDDARHTNPVQPQARNFIVFEADALTI